MSLINDALKRTTGPRRVPRPSTEGMQPADIPTEMPVEGRHKLAVTVLVLSMVGGLILATIAYMSRKQPNLEIGAFKRPHTVVSNAGPSAAGLTNPIARAAGVLQGVAQQNAEGEAMASSLQQAPVVTAAKVESPSGAQPVLATPPLASSAPTPTPAVPVIAPSSPPAASGDFPALRLQAIYFRLKAPTAMINGKTVGVGDSIEGVKVTQIQRQAVRVALNADVRELRLR